MNRDELLEKGLWFHGHKCPAMPMGLRVSMAAMEALGVEQRAGAGELVALVEIDEAHCATCFADGVQVATGCTFGKGNIKKLHYGKWGLTLIDRKQAKAACSSGDRIAVQGRRRDQQRTSARTGWRTVDGRRDFPYHALEAHTCVFQAGRHHLWRTGRGRCGDEPGSGRKQGWLTQEHFMDLLATTNLIPGANVVEMAVHTGYVRAGWPGLIVAGIAFIVPAFVVSLALGWTYVRFGSLPEGEALLYGIGPAVVAVVLVASYRMGARRFMTRARLS